MINKLYQNSKYHTGLKILNMKNLTEIKNNSPKILVLDSTHFDDENNGENLCIEGPQG